MTRLSVNINKIATLRNARGGNNPDVIQVAMDCERFGAQGITVHPRPDERHIRYSDAVALREVVRTEFNVEGYPDQRYLRIIREAKPELAHAAIRINPNRSGEETVLRILHESITQAIAGQMRT